MIIYNAPQGTPEWHAARAGVITASMFSTVRKLVGCLTEQQQIYVNALKMDMGEKQAMVAAGYKSKPRSDSIDRALAGEEIGDYSDATKDYAFRLAIERISGMTLDEGFETWSMKRGHELEPEARRLHEARYGVVVQQVGFVTSDDGLFGASADGFIDHDGGSEYKCFVDPGKLRTILLDGDITTVVDQCQGGMWLTGRKYWHAGLYCPALAAVGKDLTMYCIERDEAYIAALEQDMVKFSRLVSDYEQRLRDGGELALAA
jgi:hypothetical protein